MQTQILRTRYCTARRRTQQCCALLTTVSHLAAPRRAEDERSCLRFESGADVVEDRLAFHFLGVVR